MKNTILLLCCFVITSIFLFGCQLRPDNEFDTFEQDSDTSIKETDSHTEETDVPSIDLNTIIGVSKYDFGDK